MSEFWNCVLGFPKLLLSSKRIWKEQFTSTWGRFEAGIYEDLLCVSTAVCVTSECILSPTLHVAVSNIVVLFFLCLQVRVARYSTTWDKFILKIYYILTPRQLFAVYLKFRFNGASCILSGNSTPSTASTALLRQEWRHSSFQCSSFP